MSYDLIEVREKQQKLVADARESLDAINDDVSETRAAELEKQHDDAMAEYDKLEERAKRLEKVQEAEQRANGFERPVPVDKEAAPAEEQRNELTREGVFKRAMQYGVEGLDGEERKALAELRANVTAEMRAQGTGTGAAGAFTVPEGFQAELIQSMQAYGPMFTPGVTRRLVTDSGNPLPWPTSDDTSNKGALLSENTQASEQDLTFGQKQLDAYTYTSKIIRVPLQLLQDSAFNMGTIINEAFGERIGRIANEHLTTGTGSGQPNGILTASTLGNTAAATSAIDFDDVIDLIHGVDPAYRAMPSTRFMFHDNVLAALRKIKDNDGNYIWSPADARSGVPSNIHGYDYVVNQDMTSTITTGDKTMLFGAFDKYVTRIVQDFTMLRLQERYADYLQVGFIAFARLDGELLDTAAVKHLAQA